MINEEKYLIHLLSCAIRNKAPEPPAEDVSWNKIREIADKQKILPLLFEAVRRLEKKYQPDEELMKCWEKETLSCTLFYAFQMQHIFSLLKKAEEKEIDMLLLKGIVLRDMYPVPELRTMSDVDIIIKPEQLELVKDLFFSNGYEIISENAGPTIYHKKEVLKFEVFHVIPSGLKSAKGTEIDIWSGSLKTKGEHIFMPSPENMLLHSITHLMKHLRTRGSGIRNLADIVLLLEKSELDMSYVWEQIKILEAEKIFKGILFAAKKYFECEIQEDFFDIDEEYIDRLMEYMLMTSIYGEMENAYILDARTAEGNVWARIKNYIVKMFPPTSKLADRYGYAKKNRWLLPVAWLHRIYNIVFKEGHSVGKNIKDMKSASNTVDFQMGILEYFKL